MNTKRACSESNEKGIQRTTLVDAKRRGSAHLQRVCNEPASEARSEFKKDDEMPRSAEERGEEWGSQHVRGTLVHIPSQKSCVHCADMNSHRPPLQRHSVSNNAHIPLGWSVHCMCVMQRPVCVISFNSFKGRHLINESPASNKEQTSSGGRGTHKEWRKGWERCRAENVAENRKRFRARGIYFY